MSRYQACVFYATILEIENSPLREARDATQPSLSHSTPTSTRAPQRPPGGVRTSCALMGSAALPALHVSEVLAGGPHRVPVRAHDRSTE